VLLNLYNNAFYAVAEKSKLPAKDLSGFENLTGLGNFQPTITVNTKRSANSVFITVSDNGNGIPQKNLDKIFQPFFTTKPTGQRTGLGLSLSYDIIKAHDGEIKVETKEGEGTTFIIQLPNV
jgi:signal transduction histidine kinase